MVTQEAKYSSELRDFAWDAQMLFLLPTSSPFSHEEQKFVRNFIQCSVSQWIINVYFIGYYSILFITIFS
jgi:hypothetical protein